MLRTGLVLGLLALVGPAAIDMYLPAMPRIAEEFGTSETAVQMTLTGYFIAFGVAQLVYGPLADQAGRRLPIFLGLGIFVVGALGSALAGSAEALVAWRALQGLGGAALMVVPRAIIRDLHTGPEATKMMAMIMLVISVSPMLAPLAGSGVAAVAGWRAIFWVLALAAVACVTLMHFALPETLPPERRVKVNIRALTRAARTLLRDVPFMGLTFVGGLGMSSFFIFIALCFAAMSVWEYVAPGGGPRHGALGLDTTRGDRLFISLLAAAYIHLAWLAFASGPLWIASIIALAVAILVFSLV